MKLVTFTEKGKTRVGAFMGKHVADFRASGLPGTMLEFIEAGPQVWKDAALHLQTERLLTFAASAVSLRAPILNPHKVIGIGLNYKDHCREQNISLPTHPIIFAKFSSSIIGPGDTITWNPEVTKQVDYEVELGVIMGKRARTVDVSHALNYVFGYTVVNDISARDVQFGDKQWVRGKSLDTFCPMGPVIVTADEIPNPQALPLRCFVNNQELQKSSTAEMVFSVGELVSFISQAFTLEPGDVIATGTPGGVGVFRKPPIFLKDGDAVVAEVEGIGRLENFVHLT